MTYKFRLRSGSIELEIEGDKEFLETKLSDLSWLDAVLEKLGGLGKPAQVEEEPPMSGKLSFVEFASLLNPKTNWEKFLSIAYYLYKCEGKDLTYEDVEKYYGQARWPMPRNMWDVMSNLIRDGYMEDAGKQNDRKAFRILRKGIEYVESALKRGELP